MVNERCFASVIAALTLTLGVNGPLMVFRKFNVLFTLSDSKGRSKKFWLSHLLSIRVNGPLPLNHFLFDFIEIII